MDDSDLFGRIRGPHVVVLREFVLPSAECCACCGQERMQIVRPNNWQKRPPRRECCRCAECHSRVDLRTGNGLAPTPEAIQQAGAAERAAHFEKIRNQSAVVHRGFTGDGEPGIRRAGDAGLAYRRAGKPAGM